MMLMQGEPPDGLDSRLWIYLIFAALSVIGGLLGKKKKDEAEAAKRRPPTARAQQRRQHAPTPPRVPQQPRPARPSQQSPPVEARRAQPSLSAPPVPHREPLRPVPARIRPAPVRRPGVRAEPGLIIDVSGEPEPVIAEVLEEAAAPDEKADAGAPMPARAVRLKEAARVRPSAEAEQVRRLLRDTSGLRSAFILSEILAPPVALRENRRGRNEIGG